MKHFKILCCFSLFLMLALPLVSNSVRAVQDEESNIEEKPVVLKYGWRKGLKYGYEIELQAEIDGEARKSSGFATFELFEENTSKDLQGNPFRDQREQGNASSTAFAVTADGYLLTCAHCVQGSTSIDVEIAGKHYAGKVIDSDEHLDLAIVKIDAADLPTLMLGDSDEVELAQEVRAVGFPLSDVLGESVKISQGSVAGLIEEDGQKAFQIDAAINYGNSGGPLVDERGVVMGVTDSRLFGEDISQVGFAVPIQFARELLDKHEINYKIAVEREKLDGPELAKRVTPAVGLMKTVLGPNGYSLHQNRLLKVVGYFDRFEKVPDAAVRRLPPRMRGVIGLPEDRDVFKSRRETDTSRLILDPWGKLIDIDHQVDLPLLIGPMSLLPIETLPRTATKTWQNVRRIAISIPDPQQDADAPHLPAPPRIRPRFGPRFGPRGFEDFDEEEDDAKEDNTRWLRAKEIDRYEITGSDQNLVFISRSYELKTLDDEQAETMKLSMELQGKLMFDRQQGVFISMEMAGKFKPTLEGAERELPIKLSYHQVELGEFAGHKVAPDGAAFPATAEDPDGLTENQIASFLKMDPQDISRSTLINVVSRLARSRPQEAQSDQVVRALQQILESEDRTLRKPAIEALLHWNKTAATPFVIEAFEQADPFSKRTWIGKLSRTNDPRAAELLAGLLLEPSRRKLAQAALAEMSSAAESAVIELLENNFGDQAVAEICLMLLADLGGADAQKAIEKLLTEHQQWPAKTKAETSLKAIKMRLEERD